MSLASFQPPAEPTLPLRGSVDLWRFRDHPGNEALLDDAERRRLAAYTSPQAQRLFLAGRAGARQAAARYSGQPAGSFAICSDGRGKPSFVEPKDLHFSLSHSGGTVLAAFSSDPVGLDIECCGRARDFAAIAKRFFFPKEAEAVLQSVHDREAVFLRIWTAKEAIVKLSGAGLAGGLSLARTAPDGQAFFGERPVCLRQFVVDGHYGAVASFFPFEVKGWFDL